MSKQANNRRGHRHINAAQNSSLIENLGPIDVLDVVETAHGSRRKGLLYGDRQLGFVKSWSNAEKELLSEGFCNNKP